jgi:hypothetical protein
MNLHVVKARGLDQQLTRANIGYLKPHTRPTGYNRFQRTVFRIYKAFVSNFVIMASVRPLPDVPITHVCRD